MKETIKSLLREGRVDVFIGYKTVDKHPLPCFFTTDNLDELETIATGPSRYPLEKMALKLVREKPGTRVGLLARDCNQRALTVLYAWNQLDPDRVETVNLTCCPSQVKGQADCSALNPGRGDGFDTGGIGLTRDLEVLESLPPDERFERWSYEFEKCIKCYGCRDICPVCFCRECSLEHPDLITPGRLPVETPLFHMVRAVHMAGRCIDCGLCEEACPMDIPLRLLYRKVNEIMDRVFDYRAGAGRDLPPFSLLSEESAAAEPADEVRVAALSR